MNKSENNYAEYKKLVKKVQKEKYKRIVLPQN